MLVPSFKENVQQAWRGSQPCVAWSDQGVDLIVKLANHDELKLAVRIIIMIIIKK